MSTIILLSGVPGSGKSYWAKNNKTPNTIIVNRDAIREMIHGVYRVGDKENFITEIAHNIIAHAIYKGFDVIVDETLVKRSAREKLIKGVKKIVEMSNVGKIYFRCVQFIPLSMETMIDNKMLSPKGQSRFTWKKVIDKMIKNFEIVDLSEGFNEIDRIPVKNYALEALKMVFRHEKDCSTCESASGECSYSCEKEDGWILLNVDYRGVKIYGKGNRRLTVAGEKTKKWSTIE